MATNAIAHTSYKPLFSLQTFAGLREAAISGILIQEFPSAFLHLANAAASVESSPDATNIHSQSPSVQFFDNWSPEIDRTIVSVYALKWILAGEYERFSDGRDPEEDLSRDNFEMLKSKFETILQDDDDLYDLIHLTIINDIGKGHRLREELYSRIGDGALDADHDEVVYVAALLNLIPSLQQLDSEPRRIDILHSLQLGARLNIAQWLQAENVEDCIERAVRIPLSDRALNLKFLEVILDVAGATGQRDPTRVSTLTEVMTDSFFAMFDAFTSCQNGLMPAGLCWDIILAIKQVYLTGKGFESLPDGWTLKDKALFRILAMARVKDASSATLFSTCLDSLAQDERLRLVSGLNASTIIPYYMPGLFATVLPKSSTSYETSQQGRAMIKSLLRFLGRVLNEDVSERPAGAVYGVRDVSAARPLIASDTFQDNPGLLDMITLENIKWVVDAEEQDTDA